MIGKEVILIADETTVSKAGKSTYGVGYFYSGLQNRAINSIQYADLLCEMSFKSNRVRLVWLLFFVVFFIIVTRKLLHFHFSRNFLANVL